MSKPPLFPKNPERVCWGCDKYCPANALDCGNGTVRTQHPVEIFGEDWLEFSNKESPPAEAESCDRQLITVQSIIGVIPVAADVEEYVADPGDS